MKTYEVLDLTVPGPVIGQHSAWLPPGGASAMGIKVPFQWGGRLQKYRHPHEERYPLAQLAESVAFSVWLAARGLGPPIGEVVYFKTVVSEHPGAWWADPCGAYGYEMADAGRLPPGNLAAGLGLGLRVTDHPTLAEALRTGLLRATPGAWNDLNKPGNVVNGYLIDTRRSGWDRVEWMGRVEPLLRWHEDRGALRADLQRDGQFPFRERELPYQEYYLDGRWYEGERMVVSRAEALGLAPMAHETVLDVGCQLGGFLSHDLLHYGQDDRAQRVGLDIDPSFIGLARRLARANGWNICYRLADVSDDTSLEAGGRDFEGRLVAPDTTGFGDRLGLPALAVWLKKLWPGGVDHLLLLSMQKHVGGEERLWEIVDRLLARRTYLETNAVKAYHGGGFGFSEPWDEDPEGHPLRAGVLARGGRHVGDSTDRNLRRLYRIERGAP